MDAGTQKPEAKPTPQSPKAETITLTLEYAGVSLPLHFLERAAPCFGAATRAGAARCWQSLTQEKAAATLQIRRKNAATSRTGRFCVAPHRRLGWHGRAASLAGKPHTAEISCCRVCSASAECGYFEMAAKRVVFGQGFWQTDAHSNGADSVKTARVLADRVLFFHPRVLFVYNVFSRTIQCADSAAVCAGPLRQRHHGVLLETADHSFRSFVNAEISVKSGAPCKGN